MDDQQNPLENKPAAEESTPFSENSPVEMPFPNSSPEYWQQSSGSSFPSSHPKHPHRHPRKISHRRISILFVILVFLGALLTIPWLAEQMVYSLNRGTERAKADVARQLLKDLPVPEQRIPWVAKVVAPCVVGIRTLAPFGYHGIGMDVGSGVIVDAQGYVLTNQHVIANARTIMVRLNDGRVIEAQEIGHDQATDLAVLKIKETNLDAINWGDSQQIEVGDQVIAIGNPYDLGQTVTSGIISATERYNPIPSKRWVQEFLQTDAAINPGNSGGALVNLNGELIGINTAIFSETGGNLGIGFAIPSILAKKVYEEILKHGEMKHGWLGMYMGPTPNNQQSDQPRGVVVTGFLPQSPARDAGVKVGDIILRWNKTEIHDPLQLSHIVVLSPPGEVVTLEILRKEKIIQIEITLGIRPVEL
ncbi:MAG: trypsin-like peptidase domain-containing protein [Planctomycetaceae bacterium]|jgi:S1-C subfamily serine protease|nr:trypsin-like peptidase domain-containing protein [Planctomycetaceae bacterium]